MTMFCIAVLSQQTLNLLSDANSTFKLGTGDWVASSVGSLNTVFINDKSIFIDGGLKISDTSYPVVQLTINKLVPGRLYRASCSIFSDSLRTSIIIGIDNYKYASATLINIIHTIHCDFIARGTSEVMILAKVVPYVGWSVGDFYVDNIVVQSI